MIAPGLKSLMRSSATSFGARLPLALLTHLIPRDVIVLMYHAVDETPAPHLRNLYPCKTPAQFEADLLLLKQEFALPTWAEFIASDNRPQASERPRVLITFDDGLSDCFRSVRPLLLKHDIPCLFFVTKALVDNRTMFFRHKTSLCIEGFGRLSSLERDRFMAAAVANGLGCLNEPSEFVSWMLGLDQKLDSAIDLVCHLLDIDIDDILKTRRPYLTSDEIRQLHADGFTIGGHSVNHPRLHVLHDEEIEQEIVESCRFVRDLLDTREVPFAFPFSADGVSRHNLRLIIQHNPWIPAMFGSNGIDLDEPFIFNRINADRPPSPSGAAQSNVLDLIKTSYASALFRSVRQASARAVGI